MTRANPRNLIYELDPEIERTRRELRQRARELMAHRGNNDQNPIEEQDPPRHNPPAPAGGVIIPPIPKNNQQQPVRTVRDYLAEDLDGLNPAVTIPKFEAEHFELKPVIFNMLNTLSQFGGSAAENVRQHLKSFLKICNSFKINGVSNDVLKLKLFPYSLSDKAKAWKMTKPCTRRGSPTEIYSDATQCMDCPNGLKIQLLRQRIQQKCYVKYIQPDVEEAPKLLVAKPEQYPQSTAVNLGRISELAEAAESAKAGLPTAQQLQKLGEHTEHIHGIGICLYGKDRSVHPEDIYLYGKDRDENAEPGSCSQIFRKSSCADIQSFEFKTYRANNEVTIANSKIGGDTDIPGQIDISTSADEDYTHPSESEEAKFPAKASQPKQHRKDTPEESRPPPPFPQRPKKQKQDY
ncbi:hypothetical protein V6N12_038497 [Hibiscus sabdariffa]|uniref:Retrotransposon gag domain-containing protein n=1 Tax=Hibiscus sabdariffa TaxID=183260 RepID=A0ABR2BI58_9ROSI